MPWDSNGVIYINKVITGDGDQKTVSHSLLFLLK